MANQNSGLFLPTTEIVSTQQIMEATENNIKLQQALIRLIQAFNNTNIAVNQKDTGTFATIEFNTGQLYYGNPQRPIFRKVIIFGTLPNATTKTVAHGLNPTANWSFIKIYGWAKDPMALQFIPLPYAEPTANFSIALGVDATNVIVTTGIDYSAFTVSEIILEYIKN